MPEIHVRIITPLSDESAEALDVLGKLFAHIIADELTCPDAAGSWKPIDPRDVDYFIYPRNHTVVQRAKHDMVATIFGLNHERRMENIEERLEKICQRVQEHLLPPDQNQVSVKYVELDKSRWMTAAQTP
jgi:hypothetical protein